MNAAFGKDIVKLEVADLAGGANGRTTKWFPFPLRLRRSVSSPLRS
jgi:hypothetical protein